MAMFTANEITEQALILPNAQRAELARKLLESLEDESPDSDVATAWAEEVEKRATAYERGEVEAEEAGSVLEAARRSVERKMSK